MNLYIIGLTDTGESVAAYWADTVYDAIEASKSDGLDGFGEHRHFTALATPQEMDAYHPYDYTGERAVYLFDRLDGDYVIESMYVAADTELDAWVYAERAWGEPAYLAYKLPRSEADKILEAGWDQ